MNKTAQTSPTRNFESNEYFSLHYTSYVIGDSDYLDTTSNYSANIHSYYHENPTSHIACILFLNVPDGSSKWKGPRRVFIFCSTAIILPSLLISVPLLMRFVITGSNSYILHPSDMRMLDQRISTTWCEAETVAMNTSFTAYVTYGEPDTLETPTNLPLFDKHMSIPDDQKEYWGLYLLPGSTFTIKTCARFKGGTLLIVRGNNHMQYCAYVGENDSAGNSDQVSDSASFESRGKAHGGNGHQSSKEKGEDDVNILSKLKNFLQHHPGSRGKIQKTLQDWMLLNSSSSSSSNEFHEIPLMNSTTTAGKEVTISGEDDNNGKDATTVPTIEHGTIRRRRRAIDVLPDTESGENAAFEDNSVVNSNSTNDSIDNDDFILPHAKKSNASVLDILGQPTTESIWKTEHNQHGGVINSNVSSEDGSMSESESSFSSSEEALLKCEGIIASFKVPHEETCTDQGSFESLTLKKPITGMESNAFQFQVQERDYYYFIFGSENEKETNLIRALFQLEKTEYQLPEPVHNCTGVTECQISFRFASSEKVHIVVIVNFFPSSPNAHL